MTPSDFTAYWPEFAAADTDDVQRALDRATPYFNVSRWAGMYAEGFANLAAHFYVLDQVRRKRTAIAIQADGGNTTEKHVGPVGTTFDSLILNQQAKDPFMTTDYGRQYCFLRNLVGKGGITSP